MGRGIAMAAAGHGFSTIVYDLDSAITGQAKAVIDIELSVSTERKRISAEEKESILSNLSFTNTMQDCRASLIIEAIIEKPEAKASRFPELSLINPEDTLFATNTSSLSVTSIAEKTAFPERIAGLHFFNPANRMKLVELIRTIYNSEEMIHRLILFVNQLQKTPVICRDTPGFIVNRVARPFYLEALRLAEDGVDLETIDLLMESAGFKMGPFHLMDLIGNDINFMVSHSVYEALGKPERLRPSPVQEAQVKKGALGRKSGSGFFQYPKLSSE